MTHPLIVAGRALLLAFSLLLVAGCSTREEVGHGHGAADDHGPEGPNGGRLISGGKYALELKIEESAVPRFVAWATVDGNPVPAERVQLAVTVERLGGKREAFVFEATGSRLVSKTGVGEPHSFTIGVEAKIDGQSVAETYESFEGRTTIDASSAKEAGIAVAAVGGGDIIESIPVNGVITARRGGEAVVTARFPGVVRGVGVEVGDRVEKGQVLATIESDASLANYSLRSPISGTVVAREARVGEATGDEALFTVADLATLWVEMRIFGADATRVKLGAPLRVVRPADGASRQVSVARVSPVIDAASQSLLVHAILQNDDGGWRPGMAVRAEIETRRVQVALRVPMSAVQKLGGNDVVFVRVGDVFEGRPVTLSRRNDEFAEVLAGISAGEEIVVEQSYLVKADIEKSGATHDH